MDQVTENFWYRELGGQRDTIGETEEAFSIGAMATLRDIEMHEGLNAYCDNAARNAVKDIVGVQFRNMATVGGSIWGRFGFSDVLTVFLALDSYVETSTGLRGISKAFGQGDMDDDTAWADTISQMETGYKGLSDYFSQWDTEDAYNAWRQYAQGYEKYMDNINAGDYATGSQYVSKRTDVDMEDALWGFNRDRYDESKLFGDFLYDYINKNQDALDVAMEIPGQGEPLAGKVGAGAGAEAQIFAAGPVLHIVPGVQTLPGEVGDLILQKAPLLQFYLLQT